MLKITNYSSREPLAATNCAKMVSDNDVRGWIMTCISGIGMDLSMVKKHDADQTSIACVCGASIICADIFVRMIPRYRNFEIAHSETFLSASLSLSFGVMVYASPSISNSLL
jgi:zinc transporter, ZIP family